MKKPFLALLAVALVSSTASAQIHRPSVVGQTAVLGAVAGALVGGHNHDRWAQGAVIGAAAGAVLGSVIDDQRAQTRVVYAQPGFGQATTVPYAPVIGAAAPEVVYVNPVPQRVVYVNPAPVVVSRPVIYVSGIWNSRAHYGSHGYRHFRGHHRDYHHGSRHHDRDRGHHGRR